MAKFVEDRYIKELRVLKVSLSRNAVRKYFSKKEQQQQQQLEGTEAKKRCAIELETIDLDDVSVKIRQPQPIEKIAEPILGMENDENMIEKPAKENARIPMADKDVFGEHYNEKIIFEGFLNL